MPVAQINNHFSLLMPVAPIAQFMNVDASCTKKGLILSCSHTNFIDASCTNSSIAAVAVARPIVIHLLMPVAQFKITKETHNNFIDVSCTNSKGRLNRAAVDVPSCPIIILFVASCTNCPIYEGWCQLHQLPNLRRRPLRGRICPKEAHSLFMPVATDFPNCRRWPLRGRKAEKGTERFYILVSL